MQNYRQRRVSQIRPQDVKDYVILLHAKRVADRLQFRERQRKDMQGKPLYIIFSPGVGGVVRDAPADTDSLKSRGQIGFKLETTGYRLTPIGRNTPAMQKLSKELIDNLRHFGINVSMDALNSPDTLKTRGMGRRRSRLLGGP